MNLRALGTRCTPYLVILVALLSHNCEDIYGPGGSHAPVLSNLQYNPKAAVLDAGGGTVSVSWSVDFYDEGKDVTTLRFSSSTGIDLTTASWARGWKSGKIGRDFIIPTTALASLSFSVWVIDSMGTPSNRLSGTVDVKLDDSGSQWTERTSGTSATLNRVIWIGSQFVTVGNNGTILTSTDGTVWMQQLSSTKEALWAVARGANQTVVVGDNGVVVRWDNETQQIERDSAVTNCNLYGIAWSGKTFVAVGTGIVDSSARILSSPDGKAWTHVSSGIADGSLRGVVWAGNQFVAVGSERSSVHRNIIATSPDGMSWQVQALTSLQGLRDVVWNGSYLVAVDAGGVILNSSDGDHWASSTSGAPQLWGIAWSGTTFLAGGDGVYSSHNGTAWTRTTYYAGLRGGAWSGHQYAFVGLGGKIVTSP